MSADERHIVLVPERDYFAVRRAVRTVRADSGRPSLAWALFSAWSTRARLREALAVIEGEA